MYPFKRKTASDTSTSPELTEEERQRRKKFVIYPLMFLLFAGSMWLIFAPSEKEEEKQVKGFNTEVPDPMAAELIGDKKKAYEKEMMEQKEQERSQAMQSLSSMFGEMTGGQPAPSSEELALKTELSERDNGFAPHTAAPQDGFHASASAYQDINRTLGSFYEAPREDPEKEALKAEVEQLKQAAAVQQPAQMTYEEQVALLEKSYELAAKYTPGKDGAGTEKREETEPAANGRKARAVPVGQVSTPVVSSLPQPVSDSVLLARMAQTGYAGFHTAVGKTADGHTRNTIRACVHGDQTIRSGQSVRLRLLEPMRVGRYVLPRNSLVTGEGRIQGERLGIGIIQVEHDGIIIPVELAVYDNDGQEGIFIPGSMEANAAKEVAANLGQNLGTSISITNQSAGDQLLSELGRGAIQGVSQYISRKMREEKVHLKSGYTLMLYQNDNQ